MTARWELQEGDALDLLPQLRPRSIDALVTDPPYSSGGMVRADRCHHVATRKYSKAASSLQVAGDNRDQLQWMHWVGAWLRVATPALVPGALIGVFADWRQLTALTMAFGLAGLVYRGIVPWWKEAGRPVAGRPTQECEFVVWGTNGPRERGGPAHPGLLRGRVKPKERTIFCKKPEDAMRPLVRWAPAGGTILDPFGGSGTTGVVALREGRNAILIELAPDNAAECRRVMAEAAALQLAAA